MYIKFHKAKTASPQVLFAGIPPRRFDYRTLDLFSSDETSDRITCMSFLSHTTLSCPKDEAQDRIDVRELEGYG